MADDLFSDAETIALSTARGVEAEYPDEDLNLTHPFDPNKIRITTEPRTIDLLVRRINHNEIDLAPEFQRRARLWKPKQKGQLIESILLRIPLPIFYVAATEEDTWSVVDGLQRLTTIHDFLSDRFALAGLEYLHQLEGNRFSALPRPMQRRIEETSLVVNIIQPGTPDEVMINIFKRLNTGGMPLNGQEVRNALYKGPVRQFLADMVDTEEFKNATARSVSDIRMDAQECILRFAAFFIEDWRRYDRNDLDAYLSDAMRQLNRFSVSQLSDLADRFRFGMDAAHSIFGDDGFRKRYRPEDARRAVNKALFEAWSVNLARLPPNTVSHLVVKRHAVQRRFMQLMSEDTVFDTSISAATGTVQRVHKRFGTIEALIKQVLEN